MNYPLEEPPPQTEFYSLLGKSDSVQNRDCFEDTSPGMFSFIELLLRGDCLFSLLADF